MGLSDGLSVTVVYQNLYCASHPLGKPSLHLMVLLRS
jgi:hypothetical protein